MLPTLYVATSNPGKLRDFSAVCGREARLLPLPGLGSLPEPVEDALTFEGNASIKAQAYSRHAPGRIVLADDSGIELDALGGAPGVRSARFAQDEAFSSSSFLSSSSGTKDELNNECLVLAAANLLANQRQARYRCVLAAARDGAILACGQGSLEGYLLDVPRGNGGFGYDPLFLVLEMRLTMAELDLEARLLLSHRAKAFADLLPKLREALGSGL